MVDGELGQLVCFGVVGILDSEEVLSLSLVSLDQRRLCLPTLVDLGLLLAGDVLLLPLLVWNTVLSLDLGGVVLMMLGAWES